MSSLPWRLSEWSTLPETAHPIVDASRSTPVRHAVPIKKIELCVLLTCYNRAAHTLKCLRALQDSAHLEQVSVAVVLVDDGSSDGTADLVASEFPAVEVHRHHGFPLFWCRGMHLAVKIAKTKPRDYFVFLNDDTVLFPQALRQMLDVAVSLERSGRGPAIVVGSTQDPISLIHTYGGERRVSSWLPTTFRLVSPSLVPQSVDTFNGNIVLIPAVAFETIGNLDPVFEHAMGDIDFGLRARGKGIHLWLMPGFQGYCRVNPVAGTFGDPGQSWRSRWNHMLSRKGLPWRSWLHFTKRHCGLGWPIFFVWPYFRLALQGFRLKN